ncbi:hypothetical protein NUSPORA_00301 [Nucleospora cyclopteri]
MIIEHLKNVCNKLNIVILLENPDYKSEMNKMLRKTMRCNKRKYNSKIKFSKENVLKNI